MSANIISDAFNTKDQVNVSIQLSWSGSPNGVFSVQASIDHQEDLDGNIQEPGSWADLPLSDDISAVGSADTAYIELEGMAAPYLRIIYARVSGSGVLDAFVSGKNP